jgi:flavin prenyltransferase
MMDTTSALNPPTKPVVIAITGATGSILAFRLVKELLQMGYPIELIFTEKSIPVMVEELDFKLGGGHREAKARRVLREIDLPEAYLPQLVCYGNHELDAPSASGTHLTQGMVVLPCSMGTLGRIANGISDNLVARAADVTMKEGRKLILAPRETPLNAIHLENMLKLSRLGVTMIPPMLSFYLPDYHSLDGQIRYLIGKVLDHLGIDHQLYKRWGEPGVTLPDQVPV